MARSLVVREYLRVSRDDKKTGKSPDQQHEENLAAFAREGLVPHASEPYRDVDRSASRYARGGREDFERLVADLEGGTFDADVLAIWESSRGSRRVSEWSRLIELCEDRGVKIWVTTHSRLYDPTNARDRRSLHEDAVDAEYESDKSSERIRRNVRDAAKEGKPHGKNVYGYLRVYDPQTRELVRIEEHPEQAPIVKEAARRALAGESMYSIAKSFNERGIEPRRPKRKEHRMHHGWDGVAIKQMLTMHAYAGKRQHRGEIVGDAVWPALIEYDDWVRLQAALSPASRKRPGAFREFKHLLSGIAFCDVCGSSLRVGKQNAGGKRLVPVLDADGSPVLDEAGQPVKQVAMKQRLDRQMRPMFDKRGEPMMVIDRPHYLTYMCQGLPGRPGPDGKKGFHVAMKMESLDQIVTELVLARLERPDFVAAAAGRGSGNDAERRALLDEIDGHREWLEQVRERAERERNLDLLFDQQARVEPKIEAAQKRLEQLSEVDPWVLKVAREGAVRQAWEEMDLIERRRVIGAVLAPRVKRGARGQKGLHPERVVPGWK
ncbi:DNA invertase Pin-like site-specific DNA recombinase [Leucobacter komagatae]|uniref:DNA invertase Pin-like site-specific DNA recombinase n=1 Tax=Leucobacter komagatae TaxID=55969 RepID=A0A542Y3S7_9MICO|nr:recombinase family protein [Leucobacter komagatae]TQL42711.1 DNA invertase Pin-like site-specific DNA recombinase [Leucobacter komagatae]